MMSYCDRPSCVVNNCFKGHLPIRCITKYKASSHCDKSCGHVKEGPYLQFKSRLKTSQSTVLQGESCRDPRLEDINRLGKSLKPTIIASFSYNSFKRLANWSLEDMFFGNTFKSLRVAPPPFYTTHENIRLMSAVSYILSAPSRFWGRQQYFCRFYSID